MLLFARALTRSGKWLGIRGKFTRAVQHYNRADALKRAAHRNVMQITVKPIGKLNPVRIESDIAEVSLGRSGLRVLVEEYSGDGDSKHALEFHFDAPRGFRHLDEGDLLPYWGSKAFSPANYLFEILSGGWLDQERSSGMLNVTDAMGTYREWFICTSNGCMNVLSAREPLIREFNDL